MLKMKSPLLGHCRPGTCWKVSRGWEPREALRCCGGVTRVYRPSELVHPCVPALGSFQRTHQLPFKAQKGREVGPTASGVLEFLLRDLWLEYEFLCGVYSREERNPMFTGNSWVPLSSPCPWKPRNSSTRLRALPLSPASSLEVESWSP